MNEDAEVALKLCLALLLGALIGLERELHKNTAGLRTHMLVAMSSALLMVLSVEAAEGLGTVRDPMRLAAGVITGIGFLGAGTIIKHGATVQGLTTAASIWTAASVGLAVGVGYYLAAVLVVLLALFTLYIVHEADARLRIIKRRFRLMVTLDYSPGVLDGINALFEEMDLEIGELSIAQLRKASGRMLVEVQVKDMGGHERTELADRLMALDPVEGVEFT